MRPIYLHKYKIVIWYSAKCGCSSIKHIIYNIILNLNNNDVHGVFLDPTDERCFVDSYDPRYENYVHILIARNPKYRIVSSFITAYYILKEKYGNIKTFEDCINRLFVEHQMGHEFDHHFTQQFSEEYLRLIEHDPKFKFDKIYKIEDFDVKNFLHDNFDIEYNGDEVKLNKHNFKQHFLENAWQIDHYIVNDDTPTYDSFFNDEIENKIKKIYKIDFDMLCDYY